MAKKEKLNGVAPYIPFFWQEWRNSPSVRSMSPTQRAIYLDIIIDQWISGSFPRNAWALSKRIGAAYNSTLRLLTSYSHLFVCCKCGGSWEKADCKCGVSYETGMSKNPPLDKFRNIVNLGMPLSSHNIIKPNITQPNIIITPQVEDEPQAPPPEPETSDPKSLIDLCVSVSELLNKPTLEPSLAKRWKSALKPKLEAHSAAYVLGLLKYALEENEVWARAFASLTKQDPVEYFASKFETIEGNREGDEKFKKIRGRKTGKEQKIVEIEEKRKPMEL